MDIQSLYLILIRVVTKQFNKVEKPNNLLKSIRFADLVQGLEDWGKLFCNIIEIGTVNAQLMYPWYN